MRGFLRVVSTVEKGVCVLRGFRNFLMTRRLIVHCGGTRRGTSPSTASSNRLRFDIVSPLINALAGRSSSGLGIGWTLNGQFINLGILSPPSSTSSSHDRHLLRAGRCRIVPTWPGQGTTVFGAILRRRPPTKSCPECLSSDLPLGRHPVSLLRRRRLVAQE